MTGEVAPDGVLAKAGRPMATAIGVIAVAAMAEAGWNLGRFVLDILRLPFPLAVMFPVLLEAVAGTFAVQDLRDRRHGHVSTRMRAATYLTLLVSSGVNAVVGVTSYGRAGLLEVLPPLVLAAVIHLHGDRATRAYLSRAVHSQEWRDVQLRAAQVSSTIEVLPLLCGDDDDGRATVDLLRRRLESRTLEPGEALIAAGWHDRTARTESVSRLRRLEAVAATVWGSDSAPSAPVPDRPPMRESSEQHQDPPAPSRPRAARRPAARPRRPRVTADNDILLPTAREVAREITAGGKALTRDALRDGIRAKGKTCANARAGRLLAAIRAA